MSQMGFLVASFFCLLLALSPSYSSTSCGLNEVPFMNKCFCDVGFDRNTSTGLCMHYLFPYSLVSSSFIIFTRRQVHCPYLVLEAVTAMRYISWDY